MKDAIDEQVFTEQVLELVAYIQKRDSIDLEIAKASGGISIAGNITGVVACGSANVSITIGGNANVIGDKGSILEKDPGDIQITQAEDDREIKTALEIAEKELFDYDREEKGIYIESRKIKKIIIDVLCPSLLKTSDDIFEIAKSSTPVLLTLSLSGTISLPVQPVFFAAAAILLTRSSIAAICKDTHRSTPK